MLYLERPLWVVDRIAAAVIGFMLLVITMVLFSNAVARYFAGFTVIGGEELARCLMVWMTFLGSYLLVRTRSHVSIDLLSKALNARTSKILTSIIAVVGIAVCGYVTILGYEMTQRIFLSGQRMSSLPLARGWFYLPVPLGFGLMAISFLQMMLVEWSGLRTPKLSDFGPAADAEAVSAESFDMTGNR